MIINDLNISLILNEYGTGSLNGNDLINTIYKLTGTSSFSILGIKPSLTYTKGSSSYNGNIIQYELNPYEYNKYTDRTNQTIITKNGLYTLNKYNDNRTIPTDIEYTGPYPFAIEIERSGSNYGKLKFSRYDGKLKTEISMSNYDLIHTVNYHVIAQKTGSNLELYLNGNCIASGSDYSNLDFNIDGAIGDTHNICDVFIGQLGNGSQTLKGSVDEVKIFNRALTINEANKLAQNELSGSYNYNVGNVFYEYGLLTIISPSSEYNDFIKNSEYINQPSQSDYILNGGINNQLILTDVGSGSFTASYYEYLPMVSYSISSSYPYWPNPYENFPTNNYVNGGYASSSYNPSQSYDGNFIGE